MSAVFSSSVLEMAFYVVVVTPCMLENFEPGASRYKSDLTSAIIEMTDENSRIC